MRWRPESKNTLLFSAWIYSLYRLMWRNENNIKYNKILYNKSKRESRKLGYKICYGWAKVRGGLFFFWQNNILCILRKIRLENISKIYCAFILSILNFLIIFRWTNTKSNQDPGLYTLKTVKIGVWWITKKFIKFRNFSKN